MSIILILIALGLIYYYYTSYNKVQQELNELKNEESTNRKTSYNNSLPLPIEITSIINNSFVNVIRYTLEFLKSSIINLEKN